VGKGSDLHLLCLVGEAIAQSFGPSCEVVVHDLRKPDHSIVAIFNGHLTGRNVRDGVPDQDLYELAGHYQDKDALIGWRAHTPDGRPLRSTTVLIRDQGGHPYASLVINLDLSLVEAVHARTSFLLERDGYEKQVPIGKRRVSISSET
jgi:predicted transcriptional regulator YheO